RPVAVVGERQAGRQRPRLRDGGNRQALRGDGRAVDQAHGEGDGAGAGDGGGLLDAQGERLDHGCTDRVVGRQRHRISAAGAPRGGAGRGRVGGTTGPAGGGPASAIELTGGLAAVVMAKLPAASITNAVVAPLVKTGRSPTLLTVSVKSCVAMPTPLSAAS